MRATTRAWKAAQKEKARKMKEFNELEMIGKLEEWAIASVEKTNWTDTPLSDEEKHVMGMAVASAYHKIKETQVLNLSRLLESLSSYDK